MSQEILSQQQPEQDKSSDNQVETEKIRQKLAVDQLSENLKKNSKEAQQAKQSHAIASAREMAAEVQKIDLHELDRIDDAELLDMYKKLDEGKKAVPTEIMDLFVVQEIDPALQRVAAQLKERKVSPGEEESFDQQLIKQWAKAYAGEKITIRFANVKEVEKQVDEKTGQEVYIIPSGADVTDVMAAAKYIAPESPKQKKQLESFAQNLQDTAILLAQQKRQLSRNSDGSIASGQPEAEKDMFDDQVIVDMYEKGKKIAEFAKAGKLPPKEVQKKSVDEYAALRERIESEEIRPQYYKDRYEKEIPEDVKETAEYQKMEKLNKDRLLLFALGKNAPTDASEPGSFYNQWFTRIMDPARGDKVGKTPTGEVIHSEQEFQRWLRDHSDQVIRRIAPFVNKTALSEQLQSQKKGEQAIETSKEKLAKESIYEAISQRGKEEQAKLMDYDFSETVTFSREKAEEMSKLVEKVFPPSQLSKNVEARLSALPENPSLPQRLEALNQAVAETYTIPEDSTLKNYEPMLALQEGAFACSIRSIVLEKLLQDEFVLGGSEWKHSSLLVIDRNTLKEGETPTSYYISTGGEKGYVVEKITDDMLDQPFMQPLVDAIHQEGNDVMIHLQLKPKDEKLREQLGGAITIGNVDKINESHVWINEAAAERTAEDPTISPELQIENAKRAVLLNPYSDTGWGLLAKLTQDMPGQEAFHKTALRKAMLLNPALTEEKILQEEDYTVNYRNLGLSIDAANPPPVPTGDTRINAIVDEIREAQRQLGIEEVQFMTSREIQNRLDQLRRVSVSPIDPPPLLPTSADAAAYNKKIAAHKAEITALNLLKEPLMEELQKAENAATIIDHAKEIFPNLKPKDFELLVKKDPDAWYEYKSDQNSELVDKIKDINSPIVDRFGKEIEEAFHFLSKYARTNPEQAKVLNEKSVNRKNAMIMHLMLRLGNWEKIPGQAQQLGLEGICLGLGEDEGRVGSAFTKLATRLDTKRNDKEYVDLLSPDDAKYIADDSIDEELQLAEKNLGEYKDYYADVEVKAQTEYKEYYEKHIKRIAAIPGSPTRTEIAAAEKAVAKEITKAKLKNNFRYARDLLYCSERFHTIGSRGWSTKLKWNKEAAPLTIEGQNLTQYLYKWGYLSYEERQFLYNMEIYCAERELGKKVRVDGSNRQGESYTKGEKWLMGEPLYNGTKECNDMFGNWAAPDIQKALEDRVGEDVGKHMRLFIQLKRAYESYDASDPTASLIKQKKLLDGDIALYYPEEMTKLFRDHDRHWKGHNDDSARIREEYQDQWGMSDFNTMIENNEKRFELFNKMMEDDTIFGSLGKPDHSDTATDSKTNDARTIAQFRYDKFRQRYDNVMSTIRQMAINEAPPRQVDFTDLTSDEEQIVNSLPAGNAVELKNMMTRMQQFSHENKTLDTLLHDLTFNDMYHRVLRLDDVKLDLCEQQQRLKRNASGELIHKTTGGIISIDPTGRPTNPSDYNQAEWEYNVSLSELRPVSSKLGADPSGDLVERKWGDEYQAVLQARKEIEFLQAHPNDPKKLELAIEAGNCKEQVDGAPGFIEAFEPELMTLIKLSETPEWAKLLGVRKLPRWCPPLTELQNIYGYSATGMSAEESLALLEQVQSRLSGTEEGKKAAMKIYNKCLELASVAPNDILRRRILLIGLFSISALVMGGVLSVEASFATESGKLAA